MHGRHRLWAALAVLLAVAVHGFVVYRVWDHASWPIAALAGLALLVVLKHMGLARWLRAMWARRSAPH